MRASGELDEAVVESVVELDVAAELLLAAADVAHDVLERRGGLLERSERVC